MSESDKKQPQGKKGDFHRSPKYQQMAEQRAAEQQQSLKPTEPTENRPPTKGGFVQKFSGL